MQNTHTLISHTWFQHTINIPSESALRDNSFPKTKTLRRLQTACCTGRYREQVSDRRTGGWQICHYSFVVYYEWTTVEVDFCMLYSFTVFKSITIILFQVSIFFSLVFRRCDILQQFTFYLVLHYEVVFVCVPVCFILAISSLVLLHNPPCVCIMNEMGSFLKTFGLGGCWFTAESGFSIPLWVCFKLFNCGLKA